MIICTFIAEEGKECLAQLWAENTLCLLMMSTYHKKRCMVLSLPLNSLGSGWIITIFMIKKIRQKLSLWIQ